MMLARAIPVVFLASVLASAEVAAQTSRPVRPEEDAWVRQWIEQPAGEQVVAIYGADGEPLPLSSGPPRPAVRIDCDPALLALTPEQALERLRALADADLSAAERDQIKGHTTELAVLFELAREVDTGGLAFFQALKPLLRKQLADDGDLSFGLDPRRPLDYWLEWPFGHPANNAFYIALTRDSCRYLETYRPLFERAFTEPEEPEVDESIPVEFRELMEDPRGHRPHPFWIGLIRHMLASGKASRDFAAWFADLAVPELIKAFDDDQSTPVWALQDLRFLAHYHALSPRHMNDLLNAVGQQLLTAPAPKGLSALGNLSELSRLPGFNEEHARITLSILCARAEMDTEYQWRLQPVVKKLRTRYELSDLFPNEEVPERLAAFAETMAPKRTHPRSGPAAPRHLRASTWRLRPGQAAEQLAVVRFRAKVGETLVRSWGAQESFGSLSVVGEAQSTRWDYHFGAGKLFDPSFVDDSGSLANLNVREGPARVLLRGEFRARLGDRIARDYRDFTLYAHILECDKEPFTTDALPNRELYRLLLWRGISAGQRWRTAFAQWMVSRPEPFVRELLIERSRPADRAAAGALLWRHDWAAFDEMIPHLLEDDPLLYAPPLFDIFDGAGRYPALPAEVRQGWARKIIRTHLSQDVYGATLNRLLRLSQRLSGESFGLEAGNSVTEVNAAISKAKSWAK